MFLFSVFIINIKIQRRAGDADADAVQRHIIFIQLLVLQALPIELITNSKSD